MKALSVRQPWAEMIASGEKEVEYRSWSTTYRGPLLICASQGWDPDGPCPPEDKAKYPRGVAVCVVDLVGIQESEEPGGVYDWLIENARRVESFPVKGKLHLFDVDVTGRDIPCALKRPEPMGETIKALTVRQPMARWIDLGIKAVEVRPYATDYRGDLLIVSANAVHEELDEIVAESAAKRGVTFEERMKDYPRNVTVCVVTLKDVVPMTEDLLESACLTELPHTFSQQYAWILENPRHLKFVPFCGSHKMLDVPREILEYIKDNEE